MQRVVRSRSQTRIIEVNEHAFIAVVSSFLLENRNSSNCEVKCSSKREKQMGKGEREIIYGEQQSDAFSFDFPQDRSG